MNNMPNAVAIYLAGSKDRGNFGNVYDLKDGQLWKKFNLPNLLGDLKVWNSIFKDLTTKFPPTTVKSIFVNMHLCFERGFNYQKWFDSVKSVAKDHGYSNLHAPKNWVISATSDLLLTKENGKIFKIGDQILYGVVAGDLCLGFEIQLHLLEKENLGWKTLSGKFQKMVYFPNEKRFLEAFKSCVSSCGVSLNQVKSVVLRIDATMARIDGTIDIEEILKGQLGCKLVINFSPNRRCLNDQITSFGRYLDISGEYLAKIYSGEDYFDDYDCFVGNVCLDKYEIIMGKSTIVLPVEFQRLPCTIKKKIKNVKCNNIKLVRSSTHAWQYESKVNVVFEARALLNLETIVVTLSVDEDEHVYFKVEKDDFKKTLIISNVSKQEWKDDRPKFTFTKNSCCVEYYKHGLLWKLKDANGNDKIPFKLIFGKEIRVGDAFDESVDDLSFTMDLDVLLDEKALKKQATTSDVVLDDNGRVVVLVKTVDGIRKTTPTKIFAIFIKSILKLLEEKLEESVKEIYLKMPFLLDEHSKNSILKIIFDQLKIQTDFVC